MDDRRYAVVAWPLRVLSLHYPCRGHCHCAIRFQVDSPGMAKGIHAHSEVVASGLPDGVVELMKITIKSNDYGLGFYGDGKPLFYSKSGDDLIALIQQVVELKSESVEYDGELSDTDMEQDFA